MYRRHTDTYTTINDTREISREYQILTWDIDAGTQEFTGTGNCVDNRQMARTDESQMMTSSWGHTSQSHKQIAQNKMTSRPRMEMMNDALGCSRATQVHMEYLRLVNLKEICPSRRVGHFKGPC